MMKASSSSSSSRRGLGGWLPRLMQRRRGGHKNGEESSGSSSDCSENAQLYHHEEDDETDLEDDNSQATALENDDDDDDNTASTQGSCSTTQFNYWQEDHFDADLDWEHCAEQRDDEDYYHRQFTGGVHFDPRGPVVVEYEEMEVASGSGADTLDNSNANNNNSSNSNNNTLWYTAAELTQMKAQDVQLRKAIRRAANHQDEMEGEEEDAPVEVMVTMGAPAEGAATVADSEIETAVESENHNTSMINEPEAAAFVHLLQQMYDVASTAIIVPEEATAATRRRSDSTEEEDNTTAPHTQQQQQLQVLQDQLAHFLHQHPQFCGMEHKLLWCAVLDKKIRRRQALHLLQRGALQQYYGNLLGKGSVGKSKSGKKKSHSKSDTDNSLVVAEQVAAISRPNVVYAQQIGSAMQQETRASAAAAAAAL